MNSNRNDLGKRLAARAGGLLCTLGFHEFRVLEERFFIGQGNRIVKLECRRCGRVSTRRR